MGLWIRWPERDTLPFCMSNSWRRAVYSRISFFSCRRLCLSVYLEYASASSRGCSHFAWGELPLANCIRGQPFQTTALHLGGELAWNSSPCSWTPCLRQGWSHTPHPASEGEVQFWTKNGVSRCNPVSFRRNSKWWGDFVSTRMGNGNK
jgi:hypothetical protein